MSNYETDLCYVPLTQIEQKNSRLLDSPTEVVPSLLATIKLSRQSALNGLLRIMREVGYVSDFADGVQFPANEEAWVRAAEDDLRRASTPWANYLGQEGPLHGRDGACGSRCR